MKLFDYIGEFFFFRWLFNRPKKNEWQSMSEMNWQYRDDNDPDFDRYDDLDNYDCCECHDDFLDEQDDYDMMDDYF